MTSRSELRQSPERLMDIFLAKLAIEEDCSEASSRSSESGGTKNKAKANG